MIKLDRWKRLFRKKEQEFLISRTFDSMEEQSIMMSVDEMKGLDQSYQLGYCFVTLKNSNGIYIYRRLIEECCN